MKNTTKVFQPTMNRRNFLKSAVVLAAAPTVLLSQPKSGLVWDSFKGWFNPYNIIVSKNGFATTFASELTDLQDCHGLCATDEMVEIIVFDLEYGAEAWKRLIHTDDEKTRDKLKKSLKRVSITPYERNEIYIAVKNLRGQHDCVKNYGKSR